MVKISIVMSVYNGEVYLKEAIDSILSQTFTDFEFIIINDGSSDKSCDIIESYKDTRIKLYNKTNTGLPSSLNFGISKANSNLIARMDADDIAYSTRLEKQFNYLKENEDCVLLGTNARIIDQNGLFVYNENIDTDWEIIKQKFPKSSFIHPSVMFRKEIFDKVSGYPIFMKRAQDAVLFYRMKDFGKMSNLSETLLGYRITPTSLSARNKEDKIFIDKLVITASKGLTPNSNDLSKLDDIIKQKGSINRIWFYHVFLAKKYLWNNFDRKRAFNHLFEAMKINFISVELFFLIALSLIPSSIIKVLYKKYKS